MPIDDCEIRIAFEDEDLRKYRAYLPQAFLSSPAPLFFLAENVEDGSVLGVGSLRVLREKKDRVGRFQLYVLPEQRRKGVGKQLMQAMSDHTAKQLGVKHLLAGVPVSEGSEDELFFQALPEFKIGRTLYEFVMDTEVAWDYLNPLVQRLSKKGGLPEGYEIVPLQQADPRRVYDFVLKYLGGIPDSLRQRLGGGKGGFLPKLSLVVRTVEGPAAVLLVRKIPKGLLVDSRVVGAKYRGSWVNVALMHRFVQVVRAMGVKEVYFEGDDQLHEDTMKLARRGACEKIDTKHLYACDLITGPDESEGF